LPACHLQGKSEVGSRPEIFAVVFFLPVIYASGQRTTHSQVLRPPYRRGVILRRIAKIISEFLKVGESNPFVTK
jgi:hypothetical protein